MRDLPALALGLACAIEQSQQEGGKALLAEVDDEALKGYFAAILEELASGLEAGAEK